MNKNDFSKDILNNLINNIKSEELSLKNDEYIKSKYNKNFKDKNILAVLTEVDNINRKTNELLKLKRYGISIDLVISEKLQSVIKIENIIRKLKPRKVYLNWMDIHENNIYSDIDLCIVPTMTINDLAKLNNGISDDIISYSIFNSILSNVPLFVDVNDIVNTDIKNNFIKNMINKYISNLKDLDIILLDKTNYIKNIILLFEEDINNELESDFNDLDNIYNFKNRSISLSHKVITDKDIINIKDTNEIIVKRDAIITSLAKDTAKAKGIKFIKVK